MYVYIEIKEYNNPQKGKNKMTKSKTEQLIKYIRNHNQTVVYATRDAITVYEHTAFAESKLVTIPATSTAVRMWLGY